MDKRLTHNYAKKLHNFSRKMYDKTDLGLKRVNEIKTKNLCGSVTFHISKDGIVNKIETRMFD